MRKELTAHVHKYMGFLTETVYEMKGTTKLYIPQDDLSDTDSCVKNSDLKMRLESTVIHCQIKKVLNAGDDSQEKEEEGPLSEVEHWRCRSEDLSGIKVQLDDPRLRRAVELLTLTKSTYIDVFEKLGKEIQDSTTEALDILKFLSFMEDTATELSNASPDQIPSIIPLLLAVILIIWRLSK